MKNNIEYFRHYTDSIENPKLITLRVKFGWEGDGRYWALLSIIARQEGCWLDLNQDYQSEAVAAQLNMVRAEFGELLEYLVVSALVIRENNRITTPEMQETLKILNVEREKARQRKKKSSGEPRVENWRNEESSGELPEVRANDARSSPGGAREALKVKGKKEKVEGRSISKPPIVPPGDQKTLSELIDPYRGQFAPAMIEDFLLHFDEQDLKGVPLWKKQKTWETKKRLERWKRQQEKWDFERSQKRKFRETPDEEPRRRELPSGHTESGFQSLGSILSKK